MGLLSSLFGSKGPSGPPEVVAINHDDHHARCVGFTGDGRQFFLTTPYVPTEGTGTGREFVAIYLFDASGRLIEAKIDYLGQRGGVDPEETKRVCDAQLAILGPYSYCRIEIRPFRVERFGATFGLVMHPPAKKGDEWYATVEPGHYMIFGAPWASGDYDTET